jgi:RNA polymerase sigma factor (sigma-70 family)
MDWFLTGLRHEAIRLSKKQNRLREHELLILNTPLSNHSEDDVTEMLDSIMAVNDTLAEAIDIVFLQEALSLLPPQQQKVINAIILEEYTEQKVAEQLGISQQVVNRLKKRALTRLKKHFVLDEPTGK